MTDISDETLDAVKGFLILADEAISEAMRAMQKFPQPNYVISKIAEESGEVVKAAIHCAEGRETPENVIAEMRQTIAMLFRLYAEGDGVHGLPALFGGPRRKEEVMDAPRRFSMKHNRNGLGFYDGVEEDADGYLMTVAEHERLMAEARAKALEEAAKVANDKSHWAECPEWLLAGIDAYRQRVVTAIRAITRR